MNKLFLIYILDLGSVQVGFCHLECLDDFHKNEEVLEKPREKSSVQRSATSEMKQIRVCLDKTRITLCGYWRNNGRQNV